MSPGTIPRPMGMDFSGEFGWIAEKACVTKYKKVDEFWRPILSYYTGYCDTHELIATPNGIPVFNNTRNDCISTINDQGFAKNIYYPAFVNKKNVYEDRFHINGIALDEHQRMKYISCFTTVDYGGRKGWAEGFNEGTIWDVENECPRITGQNLPHSPRIYDGVLHWCNSGEGEVCREDGHYVRTGSFTRGMRRYEDILVVGGSRVRNTTSKVNSLKMTRNFTCLHILDFKTLKVLHTIDLHEWQTEIFDFWLFPRDILVTPGLSDGYTARLSF